MKSNKYFPDILGEANVGTYYIAPYFSLKTDNNYQTIWLDLNTKKNYFKKDTISAYNCPIIRTSTGRKNDFTLYIKQKFLPLFAIFKNQPIPIPQIINIILNPQILKQEQQQLTHYITHITQNFTINDKKELFNFVRFIEKLPKEPLPKLLSEPNYTLIFGNIEMKDEIENNVFTQTTPELKKQNITIEDIKDCFGDLILSEETFNDVFISIGLMDITADPPQFPETGGSIFIDQGGTGKSMMKKALKKLWKKIGGECIEKNGLAEFKEGVNYARLIMSWYFGNTTQEQGYDKEGLFNAALRNKVPSLLIIDEADRFVKSSDEEHKDLAAELIITEFKRYLTEKEKGGVLGYVITIFIANVDEKHLNPQLKMGGERLTPVYFGPPTKINEWLKIN